jgi:phosphatidylethanolamine/phosphatidyl-N-methylethanolamine N-methyltransferase
MKNTLLLLREFALSPGRTGAIAPSSPWLAAEIVRQAGVRKAQTIVEFGPGTGAFTREILKQKSDSAFFVAIEANPRLVETLKVQLPQTNIVADSAENTLSILKNNQKSSADCIVSGLPWASFPKELQDKLLEAAVNSLRPGGRFTTFAYLQGLLLPSGQRFRKRLEETFSKVHLGRVIWRNLPAAFVYRCVK